MKKYIAKQFTMSPMLLPIIYYNVYATAHCISCMHVLSCLWYLSCMPVSAKGSIFGQNVVVMQYLHLHHCHLH